MLEIIALFLAGFLGGVLNSIAGGGSFITFPALMLAGVPPVSANATNTFASCSGYLSGAYAFRNDLYEVRHTLPGFLALSLLGGAIGAYLLLHTPEHTFMATIPWLLLVATLLFIGGGALNSWLRRVTGRHRHASLAGSLGLGGLLVAISVYGGFFNAGLGIITLSYLALAGHTDINRMNGLKLMLSSVVSLIAVTLFIADGAIAWQQGLTVLVGTLTGGFLAAHISRRLPQAYVRAFVIIASIAITGYFFYDTYR